MKNYKIVLAYDGTRYNGWQKQGNTENTIQEKLERILKEISGQETEVFGSGRTDMGTHATGQVNCWMLSMRSCLRISRGFPLRKCSPDSTAD